MAGKGRALMPLGRMEFAILKLNDAVGMVTACFISAILLVNLSSFFKMSSGTLHPNTLVPARALSIW